MSCNCNKAIASTSCLDVLTIGTVPYEADYQVHFKTPTGRVDTYPAVFVVYTNVFYVEQPKVRIGDMYEIWINRIGDPIEKRVPFTIGEEDEEPMEVNCINMEFEACYEQTNIDQTITLQ